MNFIYFLLNVILTTEAPLFSLISNCQISEKVYEFSGTRDKKGKKPDQEITSILSTK